MPKSELRMTKANTQEGLIGNSNVMDHLPGILTRDMVQGMVVQGMVADMVADTMTTTLHSVRTVRMQFPSWVRLPVVYC
jgi:hypothetical protein